MRRRHSTIRPVEAPGAPSLWYGHIDESGVEDRSTSLGQLYEIEFSQLEAGHLQVSIDFVASTRSVLYREGYDSKTHAWGTLTGSRFGISVPVADPGGIWWGHRLAGDAVASAISGETIDIVFAPGVRHFVAIVDHPALLHAAERAGLEPQAMAAIRKGRSGHMIGFHRPAQVRLAGAFARVLEAAGSGTLGMDAARFDAFLLEAVLSLLDRDPPRLETTRAAAILFRRAVAMHDAMDPSPGVGALGIALHASPRTLEAAFHACVGMGPHRFFAQRRLSRARTALARSCAGETSVTAVALRLGFTELGRFATRYKATFGESPSDTLRTAPVSRFMIPGVPATG